MIDISLVLLSAQPTRTAANYPQNTQYRRAAYQEGGDAMEVQFSEPPALKPTQKVAIALNMPVFILPGTVVALLLPESDMAVFYASLPCVPFLWYGVGRWLDGILGYIQPLHLHRILRGMIGFLSVGLLCVSATILTPLYRHRTPDSYWVGTGMMLWSGFSLTIALSTKKATDATKTESPSK